MFTKKTTELLGKRENNDLDPVSKGSGAVQIEKNNVRNQSIEQNYKIENNDWGEHDKKTTLTVHNPQKTEESRER
jgi:hypothetical protein